MNFNMKNIYILSITDAWHSHSSKETIATYSTKKKAINGASVWASNKEKPLNSESVEELENINQTQGRVTNYIIEEFSLNPITPI